MPKAFCQFNMMKTDVKEQDDHYEVDIDLLGFKKDEPSLELKNGYLMINAAKGLDKEKKAQIEDKKYIAIEGESTFLGR